MTRRIDISWPPQRESVIAIVDRTESRKYDYVRNHLSHGVGRAAPTGPQLIETRTSGLMNESYINSRRQLGMLIVAELDPHYFLSRSECNLVSNSVHYLS